MTDPTVGWRTPSGFATDANGGWRTASAAPVVHAYDVTSNGSDLWLAGSAHVDGGSQVGAVLWRSVDGGTTWHQSVTDLPATASGLERYYWVAELGGKIYAQARHYGTTNGSGPVRVFDGQRWSTANAKLGNVCFPADTSDIEVFADQLICGRGSSVTSFDGRTLRTASAPSRTLDVGGVIGVRDVVTAEGYAWVLGGGGIIRSADGVTWQQVTASVPDNARSMVVAGGHIYIGTSDSTILRSELSVDELAPTAEAGTDERTVKGGGGKGGGKGPQK